MDASPLIAALHDGVADEGEWKNALGAISAALGDTRIMMAAVRVDLRDMDLQTHGNVDFMRGRTDVMLSADANPWISAMRTGPLRQYLGEADVSSVDVFRTSQMWKEICAPLDVHCTAAAVLDRSQNSVETVVFGGRKPIFDPAEQALIAELLPHLARAWRIRRALTHWQDLAGDLAEALHRLERGVMIVAEDGKIRFANAAAEQMLSRETLLRSRRGRLATDSPHLRALVERTSAMRDRPAASAAVPLESADSERATVVAEPITEAHCNALDQASSRGTILFIGQSDLRRSVSADRLQQAYALTPAQAALAERLIAGDTLATAAAALSISANTARTHLKAVFQRVGVSRQAELVGRALADVGGLAEQCGHGAEGPVVAVGPHTAP